MLRNSKVMNEQHLRRGSLDMNMVDLRNSKVMNEQHLRRGSLDMNMVDLTSDEPYGSNHYKGLPWASYPNKYEISFNKYKFLIEIFGDSVKLVSLGSIMFGKIWSSKHAIYPKGFKSRAKFFNIFDPANPCDYVSEIIDGGFLGPIFKVTMEKYPNETFTQSSADRCWEMVLEKLIHEIQRRESLGEELLPPLELLQGINGHDMFGFLSPYIIRSIEALDPGHQCVEYWNHRKAISKSSGRTIDGSECKVPHGSTQGVSTKLFGVTLTKLDEDDNIQGSHTFEYMKLRLQGFLKKASPNELRAMHNLFSSDAELTQSRVEFLKLIEETQKSCGRNKSKILIL